MSLKRRNRSLLEADLRDRAMDSDEPSGLGAGEGDGPVAGEGQREPGLALVGSPGGAAGIGRDDDGTALVIFAAIFAVAAARVGEAEDGSGDGRSIGQGPGAPAVARDRGAGVVGIGRIE